MIRTRRPARSGLFRRVAARATCTAAVAIGCAAPAWAQPASGSAEAWRFSLTPYVWLPTVNARIAYPLPGGGGGGGGAGGGGGIGDGFLETEIGPNQYLTKLEFALMLNAQARRGPWSLAADYIGVRAAGQGSSIGGISIGGNLLPGTRPGVSVDTGISSTLRTRLWSVVGGYALATGDAHTVDVIAGMRLGQLEAGIDWRLSGSLTLPNGTPALERTGSAQVSRNVTDAIVGLRGTWKIDGNWSLPWYVDIGTGTSQFTWQALVGAAYAFGWGEVTLAYRHLSLKGDGGSAFESVTLSGPLIGATFRF